MGMFKCPFILNEGTQRDFCGPECVSGSQTRPLTTGTASAPRRSKSGVRREENPSPVRSMRGSSFQTLRQAGLFNRLSARSPGTQAEAGGDDGSGTRM